MNTRLMRLSLITVAVVAMVGVAAAAFAGPGYGRYHMGWGDGDGGPADCPRWGGATPGDARGYGPGPGLDDAQYQQLQEKRAAFFKDTADLRQDIFQKRLEMRSEFAKKSPDSDKLVSLQKALSTLESTLDQKTLAYRIDLQKSFPDMAAGYGYGRGMMGGQGGYGPGYGRGMMGGQGGRGMMGGQGGYGPGDCWR